MRYINFFTVVVCSLVCFHALGGAPSLASTIDRFNVDNIKELEPVEFLEEKEFLDITEKIVQNPYDDPDLSYEVQIPKDWVDNVSKGKVASEEGAVSKKVLGEINRHTSPSHPEYPRSYFTVDAMELSYEIGIKNWFVNYVLINGLSLERLTFKNKKELEALYVEVKKDTTFVVRAKAIINGNKIIIARYYVSGPLYKNEKVMQAQVIDSFELLNFRDTPIESLKTYGFLNQSYFDYPPSWTLKANPVKSIKHMRARLEKNIIAGKLDGKIDIELFNKLSTPSRSTVIKKFRDEFSLNGYKLGKLIEKPDFKKHEDMTFGMMQAYQLLPESTNMVHYELWVSVLESKDYIYLVTLVTGAREEEFYIWARNIESYKQIVSRVRRNNKAGNVFDFIK